jgi:hypothetical protein
MPTLNKKPDKHTGFLEIRKIPLVTSFSSGVVPKEPKLMRLRISENINIVRPT